MFSKIKVLSIVATFLLTFELHAQSRVDLSEGSLFVLGSFAVTYEITNFKSDQRLTLKSDVGAGYFILDNLAFGLSLPGEWQMLENKFSVGLKPFTTYFFDIGNSIFPYVGGNITADYATLTVFGTGEFRLKAGLESGVLVSLSENVALDFGLKPEITFKLTNNQSWRLNIPAGFIGMRAFF